LATGNLEEHLPLVLGTQLSAGKPASEEKKRRLPRKDFPYEGKDSQGHASVPSKRKRLEFLMARKNPGKETRAGGEGGTTPLSVGGHQSGEEQAGILVKESPAGSRKEEERRLLGYEESCTATMKEFPIPLKEGKAKENVSFFTPPFPEKGRIPPWRKGEMRMNDGKNTYVCI